MSQQGALGTQSKDGAAHCRSLRIEARVTARVGSFSDKTGVELAAVMAFNLHHDTRSRTAQMERQQ